MLPSYCESGGQEAHDHRANHRHDLRVRRCAGCRDLFHAGNFAAPDWGAFASGVAPVLADAATYVGIVALGHAVMQLVSGPARGSRLARRPSSA